VVNLFTASLSAIVISQFEQHHRARWSRWRR
jgi:hypothetical protein